MIIPSQVSLSDEVDMGLSFADFDFSFLLSGEEEERLTERVKKEMRNEFRLREKRWKGGEEVAVIIQESRGATDKVFCYD